jgi:hypothetical protein
VNAKVRLWHLVAIAAGVAGGSWLFLPPAPPPPPDFTGEGFTSVRVEMRGRADGVPAVNVSSADSTVVAGLAELLRSGRAVVVCRCAALGSLEFRRPDGTAERVLLMPAHDDGSVEFRAGKGRYRVGRERFLRVVGPLGVPAARWYGWPDAEPAAAPDPARNSGSGSS